MISGILRGIGDSRMKFFHSEVIAQYCTRHLKYSLSFLFTIFGPGKGHLTPLSGNPGEYPHKPHVARDWNSPDTFPVDITGLYSFTFAWLAL